MTALSIPTIQLSGTNWYTYLRLKQALSLNLRRQVLIAVCDDLNLRDRLATSLRKDLATLQDETSAGRSSLLSADSSTITAPFSGSLLLGQPQAQPSAPDSLNRPLNAKVQLVSLSLDLNDPNPIGQIERWLTRNTISFMQRSALGFQILGIEKLTRQSPGIQWTFLRHLRTIEEHLMSLEASLLLWVPSPWLCCIQQSAMEFWRWRTGVFQFAGDPTPQEQSLGQDLEQNSIDLLQEDATVATVQRSEPDQLLNAQIPQPDQRSEELKLQEIKLQEIKHLKHRGISGEELAVAYCQLGNLYRDRIQVGNSTPQTLELAIQAYEQTLEHLEGSPISGSLSPTDVLNDLGMLYWMQYHQQLQTTSLSAKTLSHLEKSIIFYQKALMVLNPEEHLTSYIRLQRNLGGAYGDLAKIRQPIENLQQSIAAYQEALRYSQRPEASPLSPDSQSSDPLGIAQCVALYNNLGTAHWNLAQHIEGTANLNAAITAYSEALKVISPQQDSLHYGMLQTNLGTAYWNLAQHQPSEVLLLQAVKAYRSALQYRTAKADPIACATVYNNLGIVYWHVAQYHQRSDAYRTYLKRAVTAYEAALTLSQHSNSGDLTFSRVATYNNLGNTHYQLGTDSQMTDSQAERLAHLKSALQYHLQAERLEEGTLKQSASEDFGSANLVQTQKISESLDVSKQHRPCLSYVVKAIRALYQEAGVLGQNQALTQLPGHLLPEVLRFL